MIDKIISIIILLGSIGICFYLNYRALKEYSEIIG